MSKEESITMAELNRYEVIKSLLDGRLKNKEAGRSLHLTVHQIQRVKKRVFSEGVRGVYHGNKRRSNALFRWFATWLVWTSSIHFNPLYR
jgi:hypothetical protein